MFIMKKSLFNLLISGVLLTTSLATLPFVSSSALNATYKEDLFNGGKDILRAKIKVSTLQPNNQESYYGRKLEASEANKIKSLLDKAYGSYSYYYNNVKLEEMDKSNEPEAYALIPYCHQIYLIKELQKLRNSFSVGTPFLQDVEKALGAFLIYERILEESSNIIYQHLEVTESHISKDDGYMRYNVRVNPLTIYFANKRKAIQIYKLATEIPIDKLKLSELNKLYLSERISHIKNECKKVIDKKLQLKEMQDIKATRQIDLSTYNDHFSMPNSWVNYYSCLADFYEIVTNPLSITLEDVSLSDSEIADNQRLLDHRNVEASTISNLAPLKDVTPKNFEKEQKVERADNSLLASSSVSNKENTPKPSQNLKESSPKESQLSELQEDKYEVPLSDTNRLTEWLNDIINKAREKNKTLISNKALKLQSTLQSNPHLLEQLQSATSELARSLSLGQLAAVELDKKATRKVPEKFVEDYVYFMDTEIKYLKNNVRFSFVKRLLEGLGGSIDTSKEGSRIGIELMNHKIILHLHDSINGLLDGGRIVSLRMLLSKAGYQIN